MLDIAGLSPGVGNVPDLLNAVIYVAEGDLANAALSGASAIPFVGIFSTTTKIVKTNVKSKKVVKGAGGAKTGKVLSNGHSLDDMAELYAKSVNGNGKWSWMDDFPNAGGLSKADKASIKKLAVEKGLIQDVPVKTVTDSTGKTYRHADFDSAGLVKQKVDLPKNLWSESDTAQFKWLDKQIGGRPQGYTWHHSEISGQMALVPTGTHNVYNHNGGRTLNHWAYREGGR